MTAKKKAGVSVLRWLREVGDAVLADDELSPTDKRHVMLTAYWRVMYADPNGQNCYPSQQTIAGHTLLSRSAIRAADSWLIDAGFMRETSKGVRGLRIYRLILPSIAPDTDGPETVHLNTAQMDQRQSICTDPDGPSDGPSDGPETVHYLLPTNGSEEGGGGAAQPHPHSSAPLRSGGAALSREQRASAFKLVRDAIRLKPKAWDDLDRSNDRLIDAAHRLLEGGWTVEQISLRLTDLGEARKVQRKSSFIAKRLEQLPSNPDEDDALMDALADDPSHVAREIATILCNTLDDIWQPYDGYGVDALMEREPPITELVAARIFDDELQAPPRMRDAALENIAQYEYDDGEGDRTIIEKLVACLTFVGRGEGTDVAQAKRMDQLRSVRKRLPEIIETVADEMRRPF